MYGNKDVVCSGHEADNSSFPNVGKFAVISLKSVKAKNTSQMNLQQCAGLCYCNGVVLLSITIIERMELCMPSISNCSAAHN